MIKYRGNGSTEEINIFLYGDGSSSSIDVDLSKAPFCIDFKGHLPSAAFLVGEQYGSSVSYPDLTQVSFYPGTPPTGRLKLEFDSPLPEVIYGPPTKVGGASTWISLTFRLAYGGGLEVEEVGPSG